MARAFMRALVAAVCAVILLVACGGDEGGLGREDGREGEAGWLGGGGRDVEAEATEAVPAPTSTTSPSTIEDLLEDYVVDLTPIEILPPSTLCPLDEETGMYVCPPPTPEPTNEPGITSVFDLRAGDRFDAALDDIGAGVRAVRVVSCDDPTAKSRVLDVFAVEDPGGSWPGQAYIDNQAAFWCAAEARFYLYPTADGWSEGDYDITCLTDVQA
ncbi:MAG: hypothetical protein GEU28_06785 [Dehalococcoidia bacterium]|nr:hypothetical protein [Dehalococcoidia bacterium]